MLLRKINQNLWYKKNFIKLFKLKIIKLINYDNKYFDKS